MIFFCFSHFSPEGKKHPLEDFCSPQGRKCVCSSTSVFFFLFFLFVYDSFFRRAFKCVVHGGFYSDLVTVWLGPNLGLELELDAE